MYADARTPPCAIAGDARGCQHLSAAQGKPTSAPTAATRYPSLPHFLLASCTLPPASLHGIVFPLIWLPECLLIHVIFLVLPFLVKWL
jgi:hypothetical protein